MVRQYPAPGNPSQGTSYILGHTCHSVGCPAVFNKLQLLGIGETFTVTTPNGVLTYKVTKTKTYPKQDLAYKSEVFQNVQNRLVLMTCKLRSDGKSQTDNFVVFSTLVSATPN